MKGIISFLDSLNANWVSGIVGPKSDLGKDLVGEGAGHDERWVAVSASQVDETSLSEQDDVSSGSHGVSVDLRLDVADLFGVGLEPSDVDFNIEVTDIADDGILLHDVEVVANDDVSAACGRDEDLTLGSCLLHGGNFIAGH